MSEESRKNVQVLPSQIPVLKRNGSTSGKSSGISSTKSSSLPISTRHNSLSSYLPIQEIPPRSVEKRSIGVGPSPVSSPIATPVNPNGSLPSHSTSSGLKTTTTTRSRPTTCQKTKHSSHSTPSFDATQSMISTRKHKEHTTRSKPSSRGGEASQTQSFSAIYLKRKSHSRNRSGQEKSRKSTESSHTPKRSSTLQSQHSIEMSTSDGPSKSDSKESITSSISSWASRFIDYLTPQDKSPLGFALGGGGQGVGFVQDVHDYNDVPSFSYSPKTTPTTKSRETSKKLPSDSLPSDAHLDHPSPSHTPTSAPTIAATPVPAIITPGPADPLAPTNPSLAAPTPLSPNAARDAASIAHMTSPIGPSIPVLPNPSGFSLPARSVSLGRPVHAAAYGLPSMDPSKDGPPQDVQATYPALTQGIIPVSDGEAPPMSPATPSTPGTPATPSSLPQTTRSLPDSAPIHALAEAAEQAEKHDEDKRKKRSRRSSITLFLPFGDKEKSSKRDGTDTVADDARFKKEKRKSKKKFNGDSFVADESTTGTKRKRQMSILGSLKGSAPPSPGPDSVNAPDDSDFLSVPQPERERRWRRISLPAAPRKSISTDGEYDRSTSKKSVSGKGPRKARSLLSLKSSKKDKYEDEALEKKQAKAAKKKRSKKGAHFDYDSDSGMEDGQGGESDSEATATEGESGSDDARGMTRRSLALQQRKRRGREKQRSSSLTRVISSLIWESKAEKEKSNIEEPYHFNDEDVSLFMDPGAPGFKSPGLAPSPRTQMFDDLPPVNLLDREDTTTILLTRRLAHAIRPYLPHHSQLLRSWRLLYSLDQHGISINTLYQNIAESLRHESVGIRGCLMVVRCTEGKVFGVYGSEPFRCTHSFYGNGETFLWKWVSNDDPTKHDPDDLNKKNDAGVIKAWDLNGRAPSLPDEDPVRVYNWTGINDYFMLTDPGCLAFGSGDGHFGLFIDQELDNGTSSRCPTFENDLISGGPKFQVLDMEVWGFVDA